MAEASGWLLSSLARIYKLSILTYGDKEVAEEWKVDGERCRDVHSKLKPFPLHQE